MTCGEIFNSVRERGGWRSCLMPPKFAGSNDGPDWMGSGTAGDSTLMKMRFTIDGSWELEDSLEGICGRVRCEVRDQIPRRDLMAIILGGGYGRGEGGVFRSEVGEQPYNDLDFYIFLRGNRIW